MVLNQKIDKYFRDKVMKESEYFSLLLWIENHGGLSDIIKKLQQHGLQHSVISWLNDGDNFCLYPEQILSIIDSHELNDLAIECDISLMGAATLLASVFPKLVDAMSEQGKLALPPDCDFISNGINVLCHL